MAMEEQDHEENKLTQADYIEPKTPFLPTFFPSLTKTSYAASRREQVGRAHGHKLRRKRKSGGCCTKEARMKMDSQIGGFHDMDGADDADGHHDDDDVNEKIGVERRIKALQGLVPGGECLDPDKLFEETAEYIVALQVQVHALKMLASFFEGLNKEKAKVGA